MRNLAIHVPRDPKAWSKVSIGTVLAGLLSLANAEGDAPPTLDAARRQIPNLDCNPNDSNVPGETHCRAEQGKGLSSERVDLYFTGKTAVVVALSGARASIEKIVEGGIRKSATSTAHSENGTVERLSNESKVVYVLQPAVGEQWKAISAFSPAAVQSFDLQFGFAVATSSLKSEARSSSNQGPDSSGSAPPAPIVTVFGMGLGEPLAIPECALAADQSKGEFSYAIGFPTQTCFKRTTVVVAIAAHKKETVSLEFPIDALPKFGSKFRALVIDGRIEALYLVTRGIRDQDKNLADLKAKFGEPTSVTPLALKNLAGARFESFVAYWDKGNYFVEYDGTLLSFDSGQLVVETILGRGLTKADDASAKQGRRGL